MNIFIVFNGFFTLIINDVGCTVINLKEKVII